MKWADVDGAQAEATPSARGLCAGCGRRVIAKCGSQVSWHWAHEADGQTCRYESEGEWHIEWKRWLLRKDVGGELAPERLHEGAGRRADILHDRFCIELQHSCIGRDEVVERSADWDAAGFPVVWVVDASGWERYKYRPSRYQPSGLYAGLARTVEMPRRPAKWHDVGAAVVLNFDRTLLWMRGVHGSPMKVAGIDVTSMVAADPVRTLRQIAWGGEYDHQMSILSTRDVARTTFKEAIARVMPTEADMQRAVEAYHDWVEIPVGK